MSRYGATAGEQLARQLAGNRAGAVFGVPAVSRHAHELASGFRDSHIMNSPERGAFTPPPPMNTFLHVKEDASLGTCRHR